MLRTNRLRSLSLPVLCLIALAAAFTPATSARAQGTDGMVPGPISTVELNGYFDRLGMSPAQRVAAEGPHDTYKNQYRELRDGEIAEFLVEAQQMNGQIPSQEELDDFLGSMERLHDRVASLDNQFFDAVTPLLSPDQSIRMPRIRQARARVRFSGNRMMMPFGAAPNDLSVTYSRIKLALPPDTAASVDALLATYEQTVTRQYEDMWRATTGIFRHIVSAFQDAGFAELDQQEMMSNPELMQEVMQVMQRAWADAMKEITVVQDKIARLNRRLYENVTPLLDYTDGRRWRNAYFEDTYPSLRGLVKSPNAGHFEQSIDVLDVDAATRQQATDLIRNFNDRRDDIVDKLAGIVDDERGNVNPFGGMGGNANSEEEQALREKRDRLQGQLQDIEEEITTALNAVLGDDWRTRVAQAQESGEATPTANFMPVENATAYSNDSIVSNAIPSSEITRWAKQAGIDADRRSILLELHRGYMEAYRELPELTRLREFNENRWSRDEETGEFKLRSQDLDEVLALRRSATVALQKIEMAFFQDVDVAVVTSDEERQLLTRAQRLRQRDTWRGGAPNMMMDPYGTNEANVDLVRVIFESDLPTSDLAALQDAIIAYEERMERDLKTLHEAQLLAIRDQEEWQQTVVMAQQNGEEVDYTEMQRIFAESGAKRAEAASVVTATNRQAIDEMSGQLDPGSARQLRRAFNLVAYPRIYQDPVAVEDHLERAKDLEDLQPDQRDQIVTAIADYLPEYQRLSNEMIEIESNAKTMNMTDWQNADWEEWNRRRQAIERLRFDRNELCYRIANRLRVILSEDQLTRIGGLPEPVENQGPWAF